MDRLEFLGSDINQPVEMTAMLLKVYCYPGKGTKEKMIWWEIECKATNQCIAWDPDKKLAIAKAEELKYVITNKDDPVLRFYRTKVCT